MGVSKAKLLFVCSHVPASNAKEAGHKTAWFHLVKLSESFDVDLLLVVNSSEVETLPQEWPRSVSLVGFFRVNPLVKALLVLRNIYLFPPRFSVRLFPSAVKFFAAQIKYVVYSRIWFEFTETAIYYRYLPAHMPFTVSAPDVILQWSLRTSGFQRFFASWIFRTEREIFLRADQIFVQSQKDLNLVKSLYSVKSVGLLSPALSDFVSLVRRNSFDIKPRTLLFWGAMSREENYTAVLVFLRTAWPTILAKFPDAEIYIVGSNPPPQLLALRSAQGVVVTGFLDDPTFYFERAQIGIAPMISGAGVKVKVLEMLEAGLPVVASPIGAEGVPDSDDLIVSEVGVFADVICDLFSKD